MSSLEIKIYPDPVLRKKAEPLQSVGNEEKDLMRFMALTMYAGRGIGLAAPQVGISKRIIVADAGDGLVKMVNPEITQDRQTASLEEGCLSLPGKFVDMQRAEKISVSYIDENNNRLVKNFSGLIARVIQHEGDHLNGKLIIDYLPWFKKMFPKKREAPCLQ